MEIDITIIGDKEPDEKELEHLENLQVNLDEWEEMCGSACGDGSIGSVVSYGFDVAYEEMVCLELVTAFLTVLAVRFIGGLLTTFTKERG